MENSHPYLPPGFRFHPTDEELIMHYLKNKLTSPHFPSSIVADVDIYKFDPWDLPVSERATFGDKEWYFFSPRDRKYPNGARPNRAAASGYWKATGTDKLITKPSSSSSSSHDEVVGVKKALVFYKGKPPKGVKTNWIMHEYRLSEDSMAPRARDGSMRLDGWVLCRIYKKSQSKSAAASGAYADLEEIAEQKVINDGGNLDSHDSSSFWSTLEDMECSLMDDFFPISTNDVAKCKTSKMKRQIEDEVPVLSKKFLTTWNMVNSFSDIDVDKCNLNQNQYYDRIY